MTAPVRRWKTFAEYRDTVVLNHQALISWHPGAWPCVCCGGSGTIYDPHDPPCPVEGYKDVRLIKCPKCNGSRFGTLDEHRAIYHRETENYLRRIRLHRELVRNQRSGLSKLTPDEISAIKELGFHVKRVKTH